ncbi:PglL family O-oligosaccharyltransferase [Ideonella sp. BN130291]|uniref:PglL family O-oligosaccharyltransferase n=1 Tax=Ideonella sp. BN130291 TaxID=3112940 RepID=UPI002E2561D9|nr:Wzy polymerase domain-containing protein [Ideonella sp. BN130291]
MTALLYLLALAPATLLAYTVAPSATVLNQLAAIAGWGLVVASALMKCPAAQWRPLGALVAALLLYGAFQASGLVSGAVPVSMGAPTLMAVTAATAVCWAGACAGRAANEPMLGFAWALLIVGGANVAISLVQVFLPEMADGVVIARSGLPGRAVGNLRQPNHLSSLALWSTVAVVPLVECGRLSRRAAVLLFAFFVFSIELSASRTGMVGVCVLAAWGALDRRLTRFTRALLVSGVLIYAVGWGGMTLWATEGRHTFGAAARLSEADVSGSRFGIWANTLALVRAVPLTGVGVGEFNFAWTLSAFPGRPTAFFDHTHNVVLQMLVECGVVIGAAVVALFGVALWQAFRRAWSLSGVGGVSHRTAFVMVLLMALHSQFEYPLWYAYFLLPTAWAWGYCLGAPPEQQTQSPRSALRYLGVVAGAAMVVGALWAAQQYVVVSHIFEPVPGDERPLAERIEAGRKSLLFGHHADYAAVTVAEHPSTAWASFATAPHYLLDTRLMIAWATAFAERGDLDRARYIAQRLREFKKEDAAEFFAPCMQQPAPTPLPFQCEQPTRPIDWREFRDPALYR